MAFRPVVALDELWSGEMASFLVGGVRVLLLRLDDAVYAYEDRCAHLGVPLSRGTLEDGVLTCGAHHYQYDARSGAGLNPRSVRLRSFPARVEGGAVQVDVDRSGAGR